MNISMFIKKKNGNLLAITDVGDYEIAKDADNGLPYGIALPKTDIFIPISKGEGERVYNSINAVIDENKNIPVIEEHYFTPSPDNNRFCDKCKRYLTDLVHTRNSHLNPLFQSIVNNL